MIPNLKKIFNIINKPVLLLLSTIFIHLIFVKNYPVSVEFAFIDFAKLILKKLVKFRIPKYRNI